MILLGVSVVFVAITIKILRKLTTQKCKCTARLDGKTVLITGGNAGIGKATSLEIAKRGARLIMASRNTDKSHQVRAEIIEKSQNSNIHVRQLDLQSLESVRKFAKEFLATETRLDVLINNAACINRGNGAAAKVDGNEIGMQVNHIAHFLLTNLLLDLLKSSAPSRIVVVSSDAHKLGNGRLNPRDLNDLPVFWPKLLSGFLLYCITKLCNMLMVKELSKRLQGTGVTVNGVHPGAVQTDIVEGMPKIFKFIGGILAWPFLINANEGAQTTLHVAISDELQQVSGKYFINCKVAEVSKMADDEEIAQIVWETSSKLAEEKKKRSS